MQSGTSRRGCSLQPPRCSGYFDLQLCSLNRRPPWTVAETFPAQQFSTRSWNCPPCWRQAELIRLISRQWATEVKSLTSGSKLRKGKWSLPWSVESLSWDDRAKDPYSMSESPHRRQLPWRLTWILSNLRYVWNNLYCIKATETHGKLLLQYWNNPTLTNTKKKKSEKGRKSYQKWSTAEKSPKS